MRKKDLRDGMKLVMRNGEVKTFRISGTRGFSRDCDNDLLNDDLTNAGSTGDIMDIMEVHVPIFHGGTDYTMIWKREESVELESENKRLQREVDYYKELVGYLKEEINMYNKESKSQDEEIERLRNALHEFQGLSDSLHKENKNLKRSNQELIDRNNNLISRLSETESNMEHITGKYYALQIYSNKTHSLERRVKQLEEINNDLEKENKKLSKKWFW